MQMIKNFDLILFQLQIRYFIISKICEMGFRIDVNFYFVCIVFFYRVLGIELGKILILVKQLRMKKLYFILVSKDKNYVLKYMQFEL